jgi:hypothetical protein
MNAQLDHVIDEALALENDAWAIEIAKRKADLISGAAQAHSWDAAKARLRAL